MRKLAGAGALAVGLLVLLVHVPELLGRVPRSEELVLDALPKARLLHGAVEQGTLPFWTDRLFLGYPLCASGETGALDPVTWGVHRFSGLEARPAALLDLLAHHVLFALLVYALAASVLRTTVARVGVAAAMALSGFTLGHVVHGGVMRALPYIPLLGLLSARRAPVAVTGLAVGGLWLTGDPAMAGVASAGWCLWVLSHELGDARSGPALARTAAHCVPALALGLAIAACQLVPMAELAGLAGSAAPAWGHGRLDHWVSWVLPFQHGGPGDGLTAGFIGLVPLLMAISGWSLVPGALRRFAVLVGLTVLGLDLVNGALAARAAVLVELALALAYGHVLDGLARDGMTTTRAALGERWTLLARQVLVAALALGLAGGAASWLDRAAAGAELRRAASGALFGGAAVWLAARCVLRLPGPVAVRWLLALALIDSAGRFAPHVRGTLPGEPGAAREAAPIQLARVAPEARVYVRAGGLVVSLEALAAEGVANTCLDAGLGSVSGTARFPLASWFRYFGHPSDRALPGLDPVSAVWARMSPQDATRFDLANVTHMLALAKFSDLALESFSPHGMGYRRPGALGWAYLAFPVAAPIAGVPSLTIERPGAPLAHACAIRVKDAPVVERHAEGSLDISTNNVRAAWLVAPIASYPGWEATVDDAPAPLATGAGAFLAVEVPPGRHRVALRYVPRAFLNGLWISLGGLVVVLGLVVLRGTK